MRYCSTHGTPSVCYSDCGGEFLGQFSEYCQKQNIRQQFACPYASFQNAIVERRNQTLKVMARSLLLESPFGDEMWMRALHTATVICNQHVTSLRQTITPHDAFWGDTKKPHQLFVFGSVAYTVIVPKTARQGNLKYPAYIGYHVGYSENSNAMLIYNPATKSIVPQRDVRLDQHWLVEP